MDGLRRGGFPSTKGLLAGNGFSGVTVNQGASASLRNLSMGSMPEVGFRKLSFMLWALPIARMLSIEISGGCSSRIMGVGTSPETPPVVCFVSISFQSLAGVNSVAEVNPVVS